MHLKLLQVDGQSIRPNAAMEIFMIYNVSSKDFNSVLLTDLTNKTSIYLRTYLYFNKFYSSINFEPWEIQAISRSLFDRYTVLYCNILY